MKKVLIGCGVVSLIIIIGVVGCTAYACHKINQFGSAIESAGQQLEAVSKEYPFTPPEDGQVSAERFADYMNVREGVLGSVMSVSLVQELTAASAEDRAANVGIGDIFGVIGAIPEVMETTAEALRSEQMSPQEYSYFASIVLKWLQQEAAAGNTDAQEIWNGFQEALGEVETQMASNPELQKYRQRPQDIVEMVEDAEVPDSNLALVEQNREQLMDSQAALIVEMIISALVQANAPAAEMAGSSN